MNGYSLKDFCGKFLKCRSTPLSQNDVLFKRFIACILFVRVVCYITVDDSAPVLVCVCVCVCVCVSVCVCVCMCVCVCVYK